MGIFAQADKIIYILNDPLNVLVSLRMLFHDFLLNHKPSSVFVFFHFEIHQKNNIFCVFCFQKLTNGSGPSEFCKFAKINAG